MNATARLEVIGEVLVMARMGRQGLTALEKSQMWKRWKHGESFTEIGHALQRTASAIRYIVSTRGGLAPRPRKRRACALTLAQREEISRGIAAGISLRAIAAELQKAPSTISREIARNGGCERYRAATADRGAWDRARRPKKCRLALNARLRSLVAAKLKADWSPQQIAGWLKTQFPDNPAMQLSHETIYRTLFVQARGALKKDLLAHLRWQRQYRHSKRSATNGESGRNIIDPISIRERPAEVADRAVPGHWEGDLLIGNHSSQIATLVERQSRFTMLVKVDGRDTGSVVSALSKRIRRLPSTLRRSLTWDRGTELARHKEFTIATDVKVYFCDPRSPWQRGTNENTNGLLRQYFPKGTDLSHFSQAQLNRIALKLNQRPRKTLSYRTPADKLSELLQ
jgi:IS30 family transposase